MCSKLPQLPLTNHECTCQKHARTRHIIFGTACHRSPCPAGYGSHVTETLAHAQLRIHIIHSFVTNHSPWGRTGHKTGHIDGLPSCSLLTSQPAPGARKITSCILPPSIHFYRHHMFPTPHSSGEKTAPVVVLNNTSARNPGTRQSSAGLRCDSVCPSSLTRSQDATPCSVSRAWRDFTAATR